MSWPIPAHRAFTLIEALVTVSIVTLLIAITLPAIASMRRAAGSTKCLTHLRQFGLALQLYGNDHRGLLPFAEERYSLPGGYTEPLDALEAYLSVPLPSMDPRTGGVVTGAPFLCPSDREFGPTRGLSYGYVPAAFMAIARNPQVTVTRLYEWNPRLIVLQDVTRNHRQGPEPAPGIPDYKGRNILRFDGVAHPRTDSGVN